MGDSVIPVIFGGFFTILGVIIGWGLNEVSAIRRAKPKLCFKLNSTPDSELVEAELRTKTSASEYSIDIYNVGQSPVIIESFDMCWRKQLLIQCFPSSEDATVLPYHNISYVLTQQDADAIERHCKRLGFKQCCQQVRGLQGCQQAAHAGWRLHSEIRFALNCSSHGKNRIIE